VILKPPLTSFLGAPVETDIDRIEADFAFLGMPYGSPVEMRHVFSETSTAPASVREVARRHALGIDHDFYDFDLDGPLFPNRAVRLVDCGDLGGDPYDLEGNKRAATEAVRTILGRGAFPMVIGGDDSIPPIVVRAFEELGRLHVLHVDAHVDFRNEMRGVEDSYASPIRRLRDMPWVDAIVQVGLRGAGSSSPADVAAARAAGNVLVTAHELHERGPGFVLGLLPDDDAPWFVSIDVDGLDPSIAPGTGYPLPGGVTFFQVSTVLRKLATEGRIVGIDFTEHHPSRDVRDLTGLTIVRLLMLVMGLTARSPRFQK
jgi:agmatinase